MVKQDGNNLLIGTEPNKMESFTRVKTTNPEYVISKDEEFKLSVFKNDSAWYKGYLKGYNPKMGTTGMVYVGNILTQEQESHLITINADGTFSVGFPLIYPQPVYVRLPGTSGNIYFEPGETTFQAFDVTENAVERKIRFMGKTARVNIDLKAMKSIGAFDYQDLRDSILVISPQEYKTYLQNFADEEMQALEAYKQNNPVCKKALKLKEMQIEYGTWQKILSYNMIRESVYREVNKVPREQREIPLERVELDHGFYDFIDTKRINNPVSVASGGEYYFLLNRIKYSDAVRPKRPISANNMGEIFDRFEARKIDLSPQIRNLMLRLSDCKSREETEKVIKADSVLFQEFTEKYGEVHKEISIEIIAEAMEEAREKALKEYFNLDPGFAMNLMKSQDIATRMRSSFEPLTDKQKENLCLTIDNNFIANYLMEESNRLEEENARKEKAFENKKGFVMNETPKVNEGDLFDTIMKKYRGKIVFVDFWATWCGPCRIGMERMKPLKQEMRNKDIVFVYITNPTSPKKTWKLMMSEIEGEHYRLTKDEWNQMSARFKISGIPHYVLVGKEGEVLKDKLHAPSNNQLEKLFGNHLEK